MSTWIVGDIHGCVRTLENLLESVDFDPKRDVLWSVGDLVNRGPSSLEVLRIFQGLGNRARAVLGNHDLYLLARANGLGARGRDTLLPVLEAPDRPALIGWLRSQPLSIREGKTLLVHAGLAPDWAIEDAEGAARSIEAELQSEGWASFLTDLFARCADPKLSANVAWLTRVRLVNRAGGMVTGYAGTPADAPRKTEPWTGQSRALKEGAQVFYGHWAAQGHKVRGRAVGLDSGCVWGRQLTAWRLEDGHVVQVDCVDEITSR